VRITATFTDAAGANTDPTTVTATFKDPTGTTTVYTYALGTVTKSATGIYYAEFSPTISGLHWAQMAGAGTVAQVFEYSFFVKESRV